MRRSAGVFVAVLVDEGGVALASSRRASTAQAAAHQVQEILDVAVRARRVVTV